MKVTEGKWQFVTIYADSPNDCSYFATEFLNEHGVKPGEALICPQQTPIRRPGDSYMDLLIYSDKQLPRHPKF